MLSRCILFFPDVAWNLVAHRGAPVRSTMQRCCAVWLLPLQSHDRPRCLEQLLPPLDGLESWSLADGLTLDDDSPNCGWFLGLVKFL